MPTQEKADGKKCRNLDGKFCLWAAEYRRRRAA